MRMRSDGIQIDIDLIHNLTDIGELTKLATLLGYDTTVEGGDEYKDEEENVAVVRLKRSFRVFGERELVALAMVYAVVSDKSGQQVLDLIATKFKSMEFPMDKPLQDVMSIGGGPGHDGHAG